MEQRKITADLPPLSPVGLGCGRLGSMMAGQTPEEVRALIAGTLDMGVNVFDTANIYGQGRSERFLGEALRGVNDVCIITKAGQVFPLKQRLLAPLRGPASLILKRSKGMQAGLKAARSQGLPRNFNPEYLRRSLEQSLKRLGREQVEIFLLHSPRVEHLSDGAVLDGIADLKRRGLARLVGVSCEDPGVLEAVCDDRRVDVVEARFGIARRDNEPSLLKAKQRGAVVVVGGVLSGETPNEKPSVRDAVSFCVGHPSVSVTLVGTTRLNHLQEAVQAAG